MKTNIAIVGGGPAGLRAAEVAALAGANVTVYDAMPSVGRKFLVAGKSGLNLTNAEDFEPFLGRYSGSDFRLPLWREILGNFDNRDLREWASGLGIDTFEATSGKVFPKPIGGQIRAAPLLRRWIERLRAMEVQFRTRHRWVGFGDERELLFRHGEEIVSQNFDSVVLALGGGSWPETGSDGTWIGVLAGKGITIHPLRSANCGWESEWPPAFLSEAEGLPLKNIKAKAGDSSRRGELVVTSYGLEGGPIYRLGPAIRALPSPEITIDFKPDLSEEELIRRFGAVKRNYIREARRRWNLDSAAASLLKHLPDRGPWKSGKQLAREVKACRISLLRPRPLVEAISSAGGVAWSELDENLMLRKLPGVFIAGEMMDWEAPTGGYLLQGCFATGTHVGHSAVNWLKV